jgi:methionyl-tRNA formyltransferase
LAFIFGTDIIKDPLLSCLPQDRVNLHLGLSPWFRGSATLFWPFYFLQPQFAGATFHQILPEADAGQILHQCVPDLRPGDGIHDVGVRTVQSAQLALGKLLDSYADRGGWAYQEQRSTGRLFLTRDFQSSHLRVIYDLYDNKIVDAYLNGEIEQRIPRLVGAPDL